MYKALVRAEVRKVFAEINRGNWMAPAKRATPDVHHVIYGDHALGGERHTRDGFERWLQRASRILPGLRFEVTNVVVCGFPWNTWAAAEWVDEAVLRGGTAYRNDGVTCLNIRWGRTCAVHEYMDTQKVAEACAAVAGEGVVEALSPPVGDQP